MNQVGTSASWNSYIHTLTHSHTQTDCKCATMEMRCWVEVFGKTWQIKCSSCSCWVTGVLTRPSLCCCATWYTPSTHTPALDFHDVHDVSDQKGLWDTEAGLEQQELCTVCISFWNIIYIYMYICRVNWLSTTHDTLLHHTPAEMRSDFTKGIETWPMQKTGTESKR